jgi:hypothetical protein
MAGEMSVEDCRRAQAACSSRVFDEIAAVRLEIKADIGLIREAVQNVDRAVSQIKGYLGLNGAAPAEHPHKRQQDELEHLHRRISDMIGALEERAKTPRAAEVAPASPEGSLTLPRWAVIGLAGFIILVIGLALIAGEDGLRIWPKPAATMSTQAPVVVPK